MKTTERSLEERTDRARQCLSPAKEEKFNKILIIKNKKL